MTRLPSRFPALALLLMAACCCSSQAQEAPQGPTQLGGPMAFNLFVQALLEGRSAAALPDKAEWRPLVQSIKTRTGSDGDLELRAMRVARFKDQPQCGRVAFGVWQPTTKFVVANSGGQINICADGLAPLQECAQRPGVLVPTGSVCPDKSRARDTAEVRKAIEVAVAAGGRTPPAMKATATGQGQASGTTR